MVMQARPSTALQNLRHITAGGAAAGEDPALVKQRQVAIVRGIFLSMVRVHYWHEIEHGKLPRKSKASQILLYSVEKGQDMSEGKGARDWACIKKKLNFKPLINTALAYLEDHTPSYLLFGYPSDYLNKVECNAEERAVYLLTSFISAHAHAQHQLHTFISGGEDSGSSGVERLPSAEELQVMAESQEAVCFYFKNYVCVWLVSIHLSDRANIHYVSTTYQCKYIASYTYLYLLPLTYRILPAQ